MKSFVGLVKFLFKVPGVTCFLREKLCQDPLENLFGCQRQRGQVNENPTFQEFTKNTQALRVVIQQAKCVTWKLSQRKLASQMFHWLQWREHTAAKRRRKHKWYGSMHACMHAYMQSWICIKHNLHTYIIHYTYTIKMHACFSCNFLS